MHNSKRIRLSSSIFVVSAALGAVAFCTWSHATQAGTQPAVQGAQPDSTARVPRESGRFSKEKLLTDRLRRFSRRTLDDLRSSLVSAQSETTDLEREIDRIALLESPKREADLRALLMVLLDYTGWLSDEIADIEAEISADAGGISGYEVDWRSRYKGFITRRREYAGQIDALVKSYDAELLRLNEIVERRRFLIARSRELEARLADIDISLKQLKPSSPARAERQQEARRYRDELRIAQTELLALDDIDENLLKHFVVMIHRGKAWLDRNAVKTDEYAMLREAASAIDPASADNASARQSACRRVIRGYERERERLRRRLDQLDRMQERVSPAGTLRDVDRSRELLDFYEQEKSRYREELERVGVQIGAWEAELSEALSGN